MPKDHSGRICFRNPEVVAGEVFKEMPKKVSIGPLRYFFPKLRLWEFNKGFSRGNFNTTFNTP